jgi:arsenate reductase
MITVYGIPNCDTVKKARAWLTTQGLEHTFHDFKKYGVPAERLQAWRKLGGEVQKTACDAVGAKSLMLANPSVVKRPVVEWQGSSGPITVGFETPGWLEIIGK